MNDLSLKKFFLFFLILTLGGLILSWVKNYRYQHNPEYRATKDFEALKQKYAEDTYGGNTPEETLGLFIDALKKGDIELASKYFVIEKQTKWEKKLEDIKTQNKLNVMIADLEKLKLTKSNETEAFYTLSNKEKIVSIEMIFSINNNNKWKISEL